MQPNQAGMDPAWGQAQAQPPPPLAATPRPAFSLEDNSVVRDSGISAFNGIFYYTQWNTELPYSKLWLEDGAVSHEWMDIVWRLIPGPAVLLSLGVFLTMFLCCWLNTARPSSDIPKRPNRQHLRRIARSAFVVIWICSFFCLFRGMYMVITLEMQVDAIRPEIDYIGATLNRLEPQVHNAAIWLHNWQESCMGYKYIQDKIPPNILEMNKNLTAQLPNYSYQLYGVQEQFKEIPTMLHKFDEGVKAARGYYWIPVLLALFPAIVPTFFIWIIFKISHMDDDTPGEEDHDGDESRALIEKLRICSMAPMLITCLILIIIAAAMMLVGDGLALYCNHRQTNTVHLVSAFVGNGNMTSNSTTNLASFYLTGHPASNPLVELLKKAQHYAQLANDLSVIVLPALNVAGLVCGRLGHAHPARLIHDILPDINYLLPEVRRDKMYSRFDGLVNKGVCTLGVSALFWWWLTMVIAALVIMPMMLTGLNRYLIDHEEWDRRKDERDAAWLLQSQAEAATNRQRVEEQLSYYQARRSNFWSDWFGCSRRPPYRETQYGQLVVSPQ